MDKRTRKRVEIVSDYKRTFSEGPGKKVLLDLMHKFHMLNSTFDENDRLSALKQGEQNVVLFILSRMNMDTEELLKQIKDAEQQASLEE